MSLLSNSSVSFLRSVGSGLLLFGVCFSCLIKSLYASVPDWPWSAFVPWSALLIMVSALEAISPWSASVTLNRNRRRQINPTPGPSCTLQPRSLLGICDQHNKIQHSLIGVISIVVLHSVISTTVISNAFIVAAFIVAVFIVAAIIAIANRL